MMSILKTKFSYQLSAGGSAGGPQKETTSEKLVPILLQLVIMPDPGEVMPRTL